MSKSKETLPAEQPEEQPTDEAPEEPTGFGAWPDGQTGQEGT